MGIERIICDVGNTGRMEQVPRIPECVTITGVYNFHPVVSHAS